VDLVDRLVDLRPTSRIPAALLSAEDPGAVPDDASTAAFRHLRAEVLEAVERVAAISEVGAADLPPAAPTGASGFSRTGR
jgi:hypothetical protein